MNYNGRLKLSEEIMEKLNSSEYMGEHYITLQLSACKIAKLLSIDPLTVVNYLKKHKIKIRHIPECHKLMLNKDIRQILDSRKEMESLYKSMSELEIGKLLGVSQGTVCTRMKKLGIPTRTLSQSLLKRYERGDKPYIFRGLPNKTEKRLINIFSENNIPFKYTGDAKFWIADRNPDFIFDNLIIEVWGEYHHNPLIFPKREEDKINPIKRIELYEKYGFKTLVILSEHIRWHPSELIERVKTFINNQESGVFPENWEKYMSRELKPWGVIEHSNPVQTKEVIQCGCTSVK